MPEEYLILSQPSEAYAQNVSGLIWELAVPGARGNPNVGTKFWTGFVTHEDGRVALSIPEDDRLAISPNADENAIPNALLAASILNAAEAAALRADIAAHKGQLVHVREHVPLTKVGNLRTKDQMEADGWFPEQSAP